MLGCSLLHEPLHLVHESRVRVSVVILILLLLLLYWSMVMYVVRLMLLALGQPPS